VTGRSIRDSAPDSNVQLPAPGPARRRLRRLARWTGGVLAVLVVAMYAGKALWDAWYLEGYDAHAPLREVIRDVSDGPDGRRIDFTFEGLPGEPVPALLHLPAAGGPPWPCVVFLHGIGQSRSFTDELAPAFTRAGFAIVGFDQYMRGERRLDGAGPLRQAFAFRRRAAKTVIEARRLADWLCARPDIDARRLYLCGASYGAMTGAIAAACDERFRAVILTYGGADFRLLLQGRESRQALGRWTAPAAAVAAWFLAPADQLRYVGRIAPRPLLFQNGEHDRLIPTEAARAFQQAAGSGPDIRWYDSDHVGLDRTQTERVLADAIAWLREQDARPAG